jgi:hypothetical protein
MRCRGLTGHNIALTCRFLGRLHSAAPITALRTIAEVPVPRYFCFPEVYPPGGPSCEVMKEFLLPMAAAPQELPVNLFKIL